jgi:hypothetical protein
MSDLTASPSALKGRLKRTIVKTDLEPRPVVQREPKRREPGLQLATLLTAQERAALDICANRRIWTHELVRFSKAVLEGARRIIARDKPRYGDNFVFLPA